MRIISFRPNQHIFIPIVPEMGDLELRENACYETG
jgi:hypothetical protein